MIICRAISNGACVMKAKPEITYPTIEQKQAADPSVSVWVSANAGSGKTHVLVDRLIRLLLEEVDPSTILCLTYTKAAAAQMSQRLFEKLGVWAVMDDAELRKHIVALGGTPNRLKLARQLFTRALETPGGLKIQTIHAFCQSLLHLFPVEAGLAPGFSVMDEAQAAVVRKAAWSRLQQEIASDPDAATAKAFQNLEPYFDEQRFQDAIAGLLAKPSQALLAITENLEEEQLVQKAQKLLGVSSTRDSLETGILEYDPEALENYASAFSNHDRAIKLKNNLQSGADRSQKLALIRQLLFNKDGTQSKKKLTKAAIKSYPELASRFEADLDRRRNLMIELDLHERAELSANLWFIAGKMIDGYESEKRKRGLYDFSDLIARTAEMLSRDQSAQWILYKLDRGINHILVDESQDTSPEQWAIIQALTSEFFSGQGAEQSGTRTLFAVGDRKQSIFSFQGADVEQFEQVRSDTAQRITASQNQFRDVKLQVSYRSTQEILDFVDAILPPGSQAIMGIEDTAAADFHQANRKDAHGLVEIWPVIEPLDGEEPKAWDAPVDHVGDMASRKRLARQIAASIASWIGKRILTVTAEKKQTVQPDDILILVQRRSSLFSLIIAELRRAGVPVAGADRLELGKSLAVKDLLALAQVITLPSDDYSLACVLKSPLLDDALTEEELYQLAYDRGSASLWSRLSAADTPRFQKAAAALDQLTSIARYRGPYHFFASVINASRMRMLARLGPEAVDVTDTFLDLAISYERSNDNSLAGFIAWFQANEITIQRDMDRPKGEVRIMATHGAKGLEANIVILPDATEVRGGHAGPFVLTPEGLPVMISRDLSDSPLIEGLKRWRKEKEDEENARLLYVAMTRARNELYICGSIGRKSKEPPDHSWYSIIEKALAERPLQFREVEVNTEEFETVRRFGIEPQFVTPEKSTPPKPPSDPPWSWPSSLLEQLSPQREVTNPLPETSTIASSAKSAAASRGENIHMLLSQLPNWPEASRISAAQRRGAQLGLDAKTVHELLNLVTREDLQPFYANGSRGEVKVLTADADFNPRELRIDRLCIQPDAIYLLDYKTGKPQTLDKNHQYVRQLKQYATAVSQALPGREIKSAILWTDASTLEWVNTAT
jgi:ATP-dependent helicase/nuclease subunit A